MSGEQVENLKQSISNIYQKEVEIMRSVLGEIIVEREALLNNDTKKLSILTKEKDVLLEAVIKLRDHSSMALKQLKNIISVGCHQDLKFDDFIEKYPLEDFSNIQLLRGLLESLSKKIQEETLRNEYLIKNKVSITREMIRKLQGGNGPQTYGPQGHLKHKQKKTKVILINREV